MKSFGMTDKGKVRKDNQDSFIIEKCSVRDCLIVSLCDGMGGARAGGLASQLSNKAFVDYIFSKLNSRVKRLPGYEEILRSACAEANGVAYEYSRFGEEFSGMGTTIVGGVVRSNGTAYLVNVGDSRAYHIGHRGGIRQITRDHSLVEELLEAGAITKEQALRHPQRNVITRALGSEPDVEPDSYQVNLAPGDILLLCSDGLSNTLDDKELLAFARQWPEPEKLCRELMAEALSRGARDNVTVLAVLR